MCLVSRVGGRGEIGLKRNPCQASWQNRNASNAKCETFHAEAATSKRVQLERQRIQDTFKLKILTKLKHFFTPLNFLLPSVSSSIPGSSQSELVERFELGMKGGDIAAPSGKRRKGKIPYLKSNQWLSLFLTLLLLPSRSIRPSIPEVFSSFLLAAY